jgi:tetratricopeptide (TPR) repeat protein
MAHGIQRRINQLNQRVSQLYERGQYEKAIPLALRIYTLARQHFGKNHPDFAAALNNLAVLYDRIGNYTQAERLYWRALAIKRTTLGEIHPDVAASLNNLAVLYTSLGDYKQAESLYHCAHVA